MVQRLAQVVGDHQHGRAEPGRLAEDERPQLGRGPLVEGDERLVEDEEVGRDGERTGERRAPAMPPDTSRG